MFSENSTVVQAMLPSALFSGQAVGALRKNCVRKLYVQGILSLSRFLTPASLTSFAASSSSAKMRLRLLAALVLLLAAMAVSGEKMTWRNDEGNTCAVYYRFKRAMCDCGDQWGTNGKVCSGLGTIRK